MWCADKVNVALAAVSALIWVLHRWTGSPLDWGSPYGSSSSACCRAWCLSSLLHNSLHHSAGERPLGRAARRPIAVHLICSTQSLQLFCIMPFVQSSQESRKCHVCLLSCLALKFNISFAGGQLWQSIGDKGVSSALYKYMKSLLRCCTWHCKTLNCHNTVYIKDGAKLALVNPIIKALRNPLHLKMSSWGKCLNLSLKYSSAGEAVLLYLHCSYFWGVAEAILKMQEKGIKDETRPSPVVLQFQKLWHQRIVNKVTFYSLFFGSAIMLDTKLYKEVMNDKSNNPGTQKSGGGRKNIESWASSCTIFNLLLESNSYSIYNNVMLKKQKKQNQTATLKCNTQTVHSVDTLELRCSSSSKKMSDLLCKTKVNILTAWHSSSLHHFIYITVYNQAATSGAEK